MLYKLGDLETKSPTRSFRNSPVRQRFSIRWRTYEGDIPSCFPTNSDGSAKMVVLEDSSLANSKILSRADFLDIF